MGGVGHCQRCSPLLCARVHAPEDLYAPPLFVAFAAAVLALGAYGCWRVHTHRLAELPPPIVLPEPGQAYVFHHGHWTPVDAPKEPRP